MRAKGLWLLAGVVLLGGCGKPPARPTPQAEQVIKKGITIEEALRLRDETRSRCESSVSCPSGIGLVKLITPSGAPAPKNWSYAICTGFLVSDDVVATNSHCIPSDWRGNGVRCNEDRLRVQFPSQYGQGLKTEEVGCEEVLYSSPIPDAHFHALELPDVAFFRVAVSPDARRNRYSFKLRDLVTPSETHWSSNKTALKEYSQYFGNRPFQVQMDSMTPDLKGSLPWGIIGSRNCASFPAVEKEGVFQVPPYLLFEDCRSRPGNSGSPIIDPVTGSVIAFLWGGNESGEQKNTISTPVLALSFQSEAQDIWKWLVSMPQE